MGDRRREREAGCDRQRTRHGYLAAPGQGELAPPARHDAQRHRRRLDEPSLYCSGHAPARHVDVSLPIAIEVTRIAGERVVRVELIGLAAEPADGLQTVDELRLGLRETAFQL